MTGTFNLFCRADDLINEADVEQIFLRRLIEYIGYEDHQVRPKDSLTQLTVGGMRGNEAQYRPDFAVKIGDHVRWIVEAKSPSENLDRYIWQPRGYCSLINGQYRDDNPVKYFLLSNGTKTRLYQWDINEPILELDFEELIEGNDKFNQLTTLLSQTSFISRRVVQTEGDIHKLEKRPIEDVNTAFAWCHQEIYKKDNISQAAAFTEFVKVIFLKLLSDRRIRDSYPNILAEEVIEVSAEDVTFSSKWLEAQERYTPNPLDSIQFRNFIDELEKEIEAGRRKRIFDEDERISLTPETIRSVVKHIEHIYLFGVDADLNGRLFETFLNATMRGKDLGQYFTPRSVVKLGCKLAMLRVHAPVPDGSRQTDVLLDGCCGSGGFLIDALAIMWDKVNNNASLSDSEKDELKFQIANYHIYGIDVGREPPLARIARLNMYLHGDGGSSIYQADTLDKELREGTTDPAELITEKSQLRTLFRPEGFADVILTNPPFAKVYDRKTQREERILDQYALAIKDGGNRRASLKSSLMFIERYHDLLKVGGRMVTVIDDGILSGRNYKWFRDYLRQKFIIRAVISLPGDAFQRSKARVKTSLLVVEKRNPGTNQNQPTVFMYGCQYIGIDDPSRRRTLPIDHVNREKAKEEIQIVMDAYTAFLAGYGNPNFIVPPDKIGDRLDVKSCLMKAGRKIEYWQTSGIEVNELQDLVSSKAFEEEDIIDTQESDEDFVTYLRVRYDGFAEAGDEIIVSDTQYSQLYRVHAGDIVISNIAASYGSIAIVPEELDGCVVTTEYTVLETNEGVSPHVVWMLLRSPEARADMLLLATGANRTRVSWENLKNLQLPRPTEQAEESVASILRQAEAAEREALRYREQAKQLIEQPLELDNEEAQRILRAFKPPK